MFGGLAVRPVDDIGATDPVRATALRLRSQLALSGTGALEPVESALRDRRPRRATG